MRNLFYFFALVGYVRAAANTVKCGECLASSTYEWCTDGFCYDAAGECAAAGRTPKTVIDFTATNCAHTTFSTTMEINHPLETFNTGQLCNPENFTFFKVICNVDSCSMEWKSTTDNDKFIWFHSESEATSGSVWEAGQAINVPSGTP